MTPNGPIMTGDPEFPALPSVITNDTLVKIENYLNKSAEYIKKDGTLDWDKCQRLMQHAWGKIFNYINTMMLHEQIVSADLEEKVAVAKSKAVELIQKEYRGYDLKGKDMENIIDGYGDVPKAKADLTKQKAYLAWLKNLLDQCRYIPNNLRTIVELEKMKKGIY
jgi:hypothetical protein